MPLFAQLGENGRREHLGVTATTSGYTFPANGRPSANVVAVEFLNNSATAVYVHHGNDQADALANGRPITQGNSWSDSASDGPWHLFTESGTANVRMTVVYRR